MGDHHQNIMPREWKINVSKTGRREIFSEEFSPGIGAK